MKFGMMMHLSPPKLMKNQKIEKFKNKMADNRHFDKRLCRGTARRACQ